MSVEIILETTVWDEADYKVPNHVYALNKAGKCVAYRNMVTGEVKKFSKPMSFEKSKRKFKKWADMELETVAISQ